MFTFITLISLLGLLLNVNGFRTINHNERTNGLMMMSINNKLSSSSFYTAQLYSSPTAKYYNEKVNNNYYYYDIRYIYILLRYYLNIT
jgi:hypothetical protein